MIEGGALGTAAEWPYTADMGESSFPPEIRQWIASQVAEGHYADEEGYILDLVRRHMQAVQDDIEWVREMIAEGEASGISDETADTIIDNIIARRRARRG